MAKPGRRRPQESRAARAHEAPPSAAPQLSMTDRSNNRPGPSALQSPVRSPHRLRLTAQALGSPIQEPPTACWLPTPMADHSSGTREGKHWAEGLALQLLACMTKPAACALWAGVSPARPGPAVGETGHEHTHPVLPSNGRRAATCRGVRKECYSEVGGKDSCW